MNWGNLYTDKFCEVFTTQCEVFLFYSMPVYKNTFLSFYQNDHYRLSGAETLFGFER